VEVTRVALDTNRLSDLFRGDDQLQDALEACDEVWIPLIVVGELEAGFQDGGKRHRNRRLLQVVLSKATFEVLCPNDETAHYYGQLFVQLKRQGKPIPDNDLWIAALCVQHNLALLSRDRHFDRIPQLLRA
jgi:tRNA(fMet)-specific endonuclease VapC